MSAVSTTHSGKTVFRNTAVQVTINYPFDVGTKESVSALEPVFTDLFECFKMFIHTQIIRRVPRFALSIDGCCHGSRCLYVSWNKTYPELFRSAIAGQTDFAVRGCRSHAKANLYCINTNQTPCHFCLSRNKPCNRGNLLSV